jgi:regulator of protease activity HflC (stomatin/prohibitin superfamily)
VDWLPLLVLAIIVVVVAVVAAQQVHVTTIREYERGLRFRRGRLAGLLDPGTHVTVGPFDEIRPMDIRPTMLPVEGQEVLTADGAAAKISLVARYVVGDPVAAITRDAAYGRTLYLVLQLALRDAVTKRTLEATLAGRRELGPEVREAAAPRLAVLGVELLEVEVRDVMLPGELKRAYASVLAARKEGEASLERARAETAALRSLANAGRTVADNPGLLQLRILQELGASSGNTVVFGAPGAALPLKSGATGGGSGGGAGAPDAADGASRPAAGSTPRGGGRASRSAGA